MEELFQIGAITQTHGIRGEIKVFPMTDDWNSFKNRKHVLLDTGKGYLEVEIASARPQKNLVICKLKGFDHINDVEGLKGKGLYVTRENRVPCEKDEYFVSDLEGILVYTEDGTEIGQIKEVMTTGANDVYVVERKGDEDLLLPAIKECILHVDVKEKKMIVFLMPGLE